MKAWGDDKRYVNGSADGFIWARHEDDDGRRHRCKCCRSIVSTRVLVEGHRGNDQPTSRIRYCLECGSGIAALKP